jgi:ABC-type nitrate/sulfonate/bicarbonate transport system permease component
MQASARHDAATAPTPVAPLPGLAPPRRPAWSRALLAAIPLLIVLALWQGLAVVVQQLRDVPFPTPYDTVRRLLGLLHGQPLLEFSMYRHLTNSLLRWATGFGVAMVLGIIAGLLLGWSRLLERLVMPTVHVLQLIPGLAWIPVAILLFGIGERSTIFMIAVTALAPIVINTSAGVKGVDEMYLRAARMMGADDRTLFLRVLLPGSLPHLLSGLRVGLANGWRVLVAAEMIVGTGTGLGYSILQARWTLDYASSFVCLLVICLIGLFIERGVFGPLERRTVERWGLARAG